MKKWGLLKEERDEPADVAEDDERLAGEEAGEDAAEKLQEKTEGEETYDYGEAEGHDQKELHDLIRRHATKSHIEALKRDMEYDEDRERRGEEGTHFREGTEDIEEGHVDLARSRGQLHKTIDPEAGDDPELAQAYGVGPAEDDPEPWRKGRVTMKALSGPDDPRLKKNPTPEYSGKKIKPRSGSRSAALVRGAPRENQELPRKISVREAKEITRRIVERIKKEAK